MSDPSETEIEELAQKLCADEGTLYWEPHANTVRTRYQKIGRAIASEVDKERYRALAKLELRNQRGAVSRDPKGERGP